MDENMLTWKSTHAPLQAQVILIVSDRKQNSAPWETLFQQKGCSTIQEAPENALQTCKVIAPALIVIDARLSHEQRIALCKNLRTMTKEPILLLVPDCDGEQIIDIYNAGVSECLLKPVSPAFLVVKATSWLLKRRWLPHDTVSLPIYTGL